MYLGRKLQEEFIFFYQKKKCFGCKQIGRMPLIGTSQMEKDIRGMIALDYAGCTLHPKLAFQFAKRLFENLVARKTD